VIFSHLFSSLSLPLPDYGDIFAEVEDYNDGFAKAVHCAQPQQLDPLNETPDGSRPTKELGIRIGWDDEQVTIWMNRQLNALTDSPIGVQGYRIDARISGTTTWNSLLRAAGPIGVQGVPLGNFSGELAIETHPVQFQAQTTGDFWLPLYFASWSGPSLCTLDSTRIELAGGQPPSNSGRVVGLPPTIALTYDSQYDFQVRLVDHTGGGPEPGDSPVNPGPSPVGTIKFQRWIRPMAATINEINQIPVIPDPMNPPVSISLKRPLLFYPCVACTGYYSNVIAQLTADLPAAIAAGREPGLPDPDIESLQITIEVRGLAQDPTATDGPYIPIVTTSRPFPSDPTTSIVLNFAWTDIPNVYALTESATGPILLPTARDIRLSMLPICRNDPNYFGADDVRSGRSIQISLHKNSTVETNFFAPDLPSNRFTHISSNQTSLPTPLLLLPNGRPAKVIQHLRTLHPGWLLSLGSATMN
jgi:hypothetical protein